MVIQVSSENVYEVNLMFVWPCITSTMMNATNKMQQLFRLLIFLNQPYMFRATNSHILRSNFWLYMQLLVQCTDTAADRWHRSAPVGALSQKLHIVKKCSWGCANLLPETCRADLKRSINEKVVASCWLLTSLIMEWLCSEVDIYVIKFNVLLQPEWQIKRKWYLQNTNHNY